MLLEFACERQSFATSQPEQTVNSDPLNSTFLAFSVPYNTTYNGNARKLAKATSGNFKRVSKQGMAAGKLYGIDKKAYDLKKINCDWCSANLNTRGVVEYQHRLVVANAVVGLSTLANFAGLEAKGT